MAKSLSPDIRKFPNLESLSRAAANVIVETVHGAIANKGRFTLALSGGNTPRTLYSLLASKYRDKIPWASVHLFWGDERYVPKDHKESNYAIVYQTLISKLSIPPQNLHPIPIEMENPEKTAASYEEHLREFFQFSKTDESSQTFDLIILGVGEDGHTASLFSGNPVLAERGRWVASVLAPSTYQTRQRITLTLPVINRAETVFFLVSGTKKKEVVNAILKDQETAKKLYPAAMVRPKGRAVWFLDAEAASGP
ncbi:MAG: 6-phosphogluconolactonase [Candidatus Hydrothermarchaeales archaeon]